MFFSLLPPLLRQLARQHELACLPFLALALASVACQGFKQAAPAPIQAPGQLKPWHSLVTSFSLPAAQSWDDLAYFSQKPHPFGSPQQRQVLRWLGQRLQSSGLTSLEQPFLAQTPKPLRPQAAASVQLPLSEERQGFNVLAHAAISSQARCYILLASHSDTKHFEHFAYHGANDSASSSILLLHLMGYLQKNATMLRKQQSFACDVLGLWFDGEEAVLTNWDDGRRHHPAQLEDHTYGSRYFVSQLQACTFAGAAARCLAGSAQVKALPLVSLILLDMVGSPGLQLSHDLYSSQQLRHHLLQAAHTLDLQALLHPSPQAISDDHIPFRQAGIAALNLIDFHHLEHWHQASDTLAELSLRSLEEAGKLALYLALQGSAEPQVFFQTADSQS